jgi:threonine/homoserine/homoserine lactone efflux protein
MPGPLLTVTISESSRRGMMTGPLLIAGHALLEMTLVLALIMGLAPLLKLEPVFIIIALAGSACCFGWASTCSSRSGHDPDHRKLVRVRART